MAVATKGGVIDGRYLVGAAIRHTPATSIHLGVDARTGTPVEVESMQPGFAPTSFAANALVREARAAAQVNHPNACAPIDIGTESDGTPYVVRRHVDGETLTDRMILTGVLPIGEVMRVGLDLLSVLVAAHDANIVHGSIDPKRVYIADRDGVVLSVSLSGFGSREWDIDSEDDEALGFSNLVFVAPERIDGEPSSVAADLYAVAAILFVAATGAPPYAATRDGIPPRLLRVLLQALDPRPERRFPSARAMLHALLVARVNLGTAYAPEAESIRPNLRASGIHRIGREIRALELDLDGDDAAAANDDVDVDVEPTPTKRSYPCLVEPTLVSRVG